MRSDPEGVVEAAIASFGLADFEATAAYLSPDVKYALYVDKDVLPYAGEFEGRDAVLDCYKNIATQFVIVLYRPRNLIAVDEVVRGQVEFVFRHKASGETIDGIMRLVAEVQSGLIVRMREYHDVERIRAFMRLCQWGAAPEARSPDGSNEPVA